MNIKDISEEDIRFLAENRFLLYPNREVRCAVKPPEDALEKFRGNVQHYTDLLVLLYSGDDIGERWLNHLIPVDSGREVILSLDDKYTYETLTINFMEKDISHYDEDKLKRIDIVNPHISFCYFIDPSLTPSEKSIEPTTGFLMDWDNNFAYTCTMNMSDGGEFRSFVAPIIQALGSMEACFLWAEYHQLFRSISLSTFNPTDGI